MLTGAGRVAGVIGWPVAHSRSPVLHGHWLRRYGVDGAYVPLAVAPEGLEAAVRGLRAAGFAGVNVTVPHKEAALPLCDRVEPAALRLGAVNTLVFGEEGIVGSNTDGAGFMANLRAHGVEVLGPALVLGAGGAARAIAGALVDAGVEVVVANRGRGRAEALARALPGVGVVDWDAREGAVAGCGLLVNTTKAGMAGEEELVMGLGAAGAGLVVADIVYAPVETGLLRRARGMGLRTVGGIGMLLHQAVPGFRAWFGVEPAVDAELERVVLGE